MTRDGRGELAAREAERSDEELRAAQGLVALGLYRVAVTPAYFAAFHMARAVLYAHDLVPRSHEGVVHLVSLHFVRTGKLDVADGRTLARLHKYRGEADYGDGFVIDGAAADEDIAASRQLCDRLRTLLPPAGASLTVLSLWPRS